MNTTNGSILNKRTRFLTAAIIGPLVICTLSSMVSAAAAPPRMKRADSFLGIHFDFHAGEDCTRVGERTTPEMVETIIDKVRPDYIQIDCKGHRGYCSYPTKLGNGAPGFVGDPLRIWCDVTRRRGVALYMHYSGVADDLAIQKHPEWAAVNAEGKRETRATSVFSPYVDELMIPQLRELAGEYGTDGVWVDGDCWATVLDYGDVAVRKFCKQTGAKAAPKGPEDPYWLEWRDFHREAFRNYVRHYVDEMRKSHPDFQVISNWSFSDHMPEEVSANVTVLSGDFRSSNSVNSARFGGRCLEDQGLPWDLMAWSFTGRPRVSKPAVQLMQEGAIPLALGGGYQVYFKQERDGSVQTEKMDVMAEVARFCRERQAFCHGSVAVPQIALLYSTAGHYRVAPRLFHFSGSIGVTNLREALTIALQNQYSIQILSEHHLRGKMSQWPVIVVPGFEYLEPEFRQELADYAKAGGRLLLIGPGPAKLFASELKAGDKGAPGITAVDAVDADSFPSVLKKVLPEPIVRVTGSNEIDLSARMLNGRLGIHLVNTSGPHEKPPLGGIKEISPVGPITVAIRLSEKPKSVVQQPEGKKLEVTWADGRASVTLPKLEIYSILEINP